ncbi:MAG: tetratricopeptide repeat protein [Longimicrobiales bacterium]
MKKAAPADLQRWSEELASDPTSIAFLPLARAYRRQNRGDAAFRLCLRGLEHHPDNTEAHGLLALLYVDRDDHARAADEWAFVLRLDPSNFEALRGLGFCLLQDGELPRARTHLEHAALIRPDDAAVRDALRLVIERSEQERATAPASEQDEPWMQTPDPSAYAPAEDGAAPYATPEPAPYATPEVYATPEPAAYSTREPEPWAAAPPAADASAAQPHVTSSSSADPTRLFDTIVGGPVLGALLLDTRGMVLAGALDRDTHAVEALAAVLGGATGEAARTAMMLGLGQWRGLMMETRQALLHIAPVDGDAVVLLVARADAPAGWMLRSAALAAVLAQQFLEAYA